VLSSKRNVPSLFFAACVLAVVGSGAALAQSTFGSFIGTVKDPSGAVVADCNITVTNTATSAQRTLTTDGNGNYVVPNLEPDTYTLLMQKSGFEARNYTNIVLTARQQIRLDGVLSVSAQTQTVTVSEASAPPITTDVSNIAETKLGRELNDLPLAIASRGNGSTSAYSTLTMQPGVETDSGGTNMSIDGLKTSQMSISIDGISTMSPKSTTPIAELFPSFDSIAEIRVSEINNAAEFGGVGDITTISKSGSNVYHGSLFENNQNTVYDARNPFSATVPKLDLNDFGFSISGPLSIPHFYNGKNKTFFFADGEFLRRPSETPLILSYPTQALRNGDLSSLGGTILNPSTGLPFANNQIPQTMINPLSAAFLKYMFPLPNTGSGLVNNYVTNFPASINSDQADLRLDQQVTPNQQFNVRATLKYKLTNTAPTDPVAGDTLVPEHDFAVTGAYNWIIRPTLLNEIRGGYTGQHTATTNSLPGALIASELGTTPYLPGPLSAGDSAPSVTISGFSVASGGASSLSQTSTMQVLDNLTYNHGKHTYKFGFDFRRIYAFYNNVDANDKQGLYTFNNSTATKGAIGNAFASFLLGIPDNITIGTITDGDATGITQAYAGYAQDDYKVTPRLTVNYGMRYEYHPNFVDKYGNVANFLPNYQSVQNGVGVHGAIVIPDGSAKFINPAFAQQIAPMPILFASQIPGLPESLRYSQKTDYAPRVGFAYRATADGKTVIRGGFGKYIETPLSALLDAQFAIEATAVSQFTNVITAGKPLYQFPAAYPSNIAKPGTLYLDLAADLHYQDPFTLQWNLTVERDLGYQTGLRISYDGNHSGNLLLSDNPNQVPANTAGFTKASAVSTPYPLLYQIAYQTNGSRQNYDALTVALNKRLSKGVQFQFSYNYARNLSDEGGKAPTGFAGQLGSTTSDYYNPNLDYGNVAFTRRNRVLATFLYEIPGLHTNSIVSQITNGFQLSGVIVAQSGPFLTVVDTSADPAGTNQVNFEGSGRTDIVSGVSTTPANQSIHNWINAAAYAIPANNIGRFGDAPIGSVLGPGTQSVSISVARNIRFKEKVTLRLQAAATNLFNHPNYAVPGTTLGTSTFGVISNVQSVEGGGPRALQMTGRITF
jgi:hypothetical protein